MRPLLSRLNPWQGLSALPRAVQVLCFATFVNRVGGMVLPFLTLYLTKHRGFTADEAGFVFGVYGVASLIAAPLSGRLCDRIGSATVMRLSLVATALVLIAYPFARSWGAVLTLTAALSYCNESFRPASFTLVTELAPPEQRKAAYAFHRLATNLGLSIGPTVGGFLSTFSYPSLFFVNAATNLLGAGVLWWAQFPRLRRAPGFVPASGAAWRDRALLAFLVGTVLFAIVFFQHMTGLTYDADSRLGLGTEWIGVLFAVNTLLIVLFEVRLNLAMAAWSARSQMVLGALLTAVGFGGVAFVTGPVGLYATVVLWTLGEMMLLPAAALFVSEIAPAERRGEYMGLYMFAFGLAFTLGTSFSVPLYVRGGAFWFWLACGLLCTLAALQFARSRLSPPTAAVSQRAP